MRTMMTSEISPTSIRTITPLRVSQLMQFSTLMLLKSWIVLEQ